MLTKATKIISLHPNNAKHIKGFDMNINEMTEFKSTTTINPHFLLGSEKLFINPMNNFSNQFKHDHSIILIESHDRKTMSTEDIRVKTKSYNRNLAIHWDINYKAVVELVDYCNLKLTKQLSRCNQHKFPSLLTSSSARTRS